MRTLRACGASRLSLAPWWSGRIRAQKHGGPRRGAGAVLLGMGALGRTADEPDLSDLDLIVIYDADGVQKVLGREAALWPRVTYFARLTQAMITAI